MDLMWQSLTPSEADPVLTGSCRINARERETVTLLMVLFFIFSPPCSLNKQEFNNANDVSISVRVNAFNCAMIGLMPHNALIN